jgi:hypothetical protein
MMLTFMFLNAVKIDVANRSGEPIIWNDDKMQEKGRPLIFDAVDVQTDATHVECLCVQFFMTISVMLMVWTNRG